MHCKKNIFFNLDIRDLESIVFPIILGKQMSPALAGIAYALTIPSPEISSGLDQDVHFMGPWTTCPQPSFSVSYGEKFYAFPKANNSQRCKSKQSKHWPKCKQNQQALLNQCRVTGQCSQPNVTMSNWRVPHKQLAQITKCCKMNRTNFKTHNSNQTNPASQCQPLARRHWHR